MNLKAELLLRIEHFLRVSTIVRLSDRQAAEILLSLPLDLRAANGQREREMIVLRDQLVRRLSTKLTASWIQDGDLDKIFAVLIALQKHAPSVVNGTILAYAAKRLVLTEQAVGGPYAAQSGAVDLVANARIALCLQQAGAMLPSLLDYLDRLASVSLADGGYSGRLWQVVSRLDDPRLRSKAASWLAASKIGDSQAEIAMLRADITLQLYASSDTEKAQSKAQAQASKRHWQAMHDDIIQACFREVSTIPPALREPMTILLQRIQQADTNYEIGLLAAFVSAGHPEVDRQDLCYLGQANVYAWLAYVIYDDFIDDEGQPEQLSVANVAIRLSLRHYQRFGATDPDIQQLVQAAFDEVDAANAWEVYHCRFRHAAGHITIGSLPEFGDLAFLAQRSFIHALGPLVALRLQGVAINTPTWRGLRQALHHYLIARQLNDDMLDCFDDLAAGQVTYVVTVLLRHARVQPATYVSEHLEKHLRRVFWQEVLPELVATTKEHLGKARRYLDDAQYFSAADDLYGLLDDIDQALDAGMAKRAQNQEFLQAFTAD